MLVQQAQLGARDRIALEWERASVAFELITDTDVRSRVADARRRFEESHGRTENRIEALQRDLSTALVEPALRRVEEIRNKFDAAARVEEQTIERAHEAAELLSSALAGLDIARQAAMAPHRLIPFHLPGQWNG